MKEKKKEKLRKETEEILAEFIKELKENGYSDKQIKEKFKKNNYPKEVFEILELNTREVKMEKENKEIEEVEEVEEEEVDEDIDDEELEEQETEEEIKEVKEVKKVKKKIEISKPKEVEKVKGPTTQELITAVQSIGQSTMELNQRVESIEASLYRKNL